MTEGMEESALVDESACRICGRGDDRPMCFKGLPYCSDLCHKALIAEVTAEAAGDVGEAEKERDWHPFQPSSNSPGAVCMVCRCAPSRAHPDWEWQIDAWVRRLV